MSGNVFLPTARIYKAAQRLSDTTGLRSRKFRLIGTVSTTTGQTITLVDEITTRKALGGKLTPTPFAQLSPLDANRVHLNKPFAYTVLITMPEGETPEGGPVMVTFPFAPPRLNK